MPRIAPLSICIVYASFLYSLFRISYLSKKNIMNNEEQNTKNLERIAKNVAFIAWTIIIGIGSTLLGVAFVAQYG